MKNSEYATAFDNGVLERFKNDPEWFKKIIARDSFYTNEGNVRHVRYIENLGNEDKPIVTLLKYIRPITPDSKNAIDDEVQISLEHLDGNSCVVLIAREDGDYLEPVTGTRVADACFYGGSAEEIYSYSIGKDTFATLAYNNDEHPPCGIIDLNTVEKYKEVMGPHKDDLIKYFEEVKLRTNRNFGSGYLSTEEVDSILRP